jgi:hydrogenase nickel incorporation protein HypA/HybF
MHEEALLREIREKIVEVAKANGARKVTKVRLWIGALSEIPGDHMKEEWPRTVDGTIAQGAELEVETSTDIRDPRANDIIVTSMDID